MNALFWLEIYLVANLSVTLVSLLSEEKEEVMDFLPSWVLFGSLFWFIIGLCLLLDVDWCRERRFWWRK